MKLTTQFFLAIAPGASLSIVNAIIANQAVLDRYGITDGTELAWFFGQVACETQAFNRIEENLFYTSTARLRAVFPTHFKSDADAARCVRNPVALANLVYGGRYGNTAPSDGYAYRGSGTLQTTFKNNYAAVGAVYLTNPNLLRSFPSALEAACVYWRDHKCAGYVANNDLPGLTRAIQGGSSGLADRKLFTDRALSFVRNTKVVDMVAPTPAAIQHPEWLRRGMTGPLILDLQTKLQAAGYYVGGKLDSGFGDGTENALVEFQRDHGLVADGVAGEKTQAALAVAAMVAKPPKIDPAAPGVVVPGASAAGGLVGLLAKLLALILSALGKGR